MVRTGPDGIGRDHRAAANFAFAGAICFVVSSLLYIDAFAVLTTTRSTAPGGFQGYQQLNTTNLQAIWEGRRSSQGAFLFAELFGALGWFSLMPPVASMTAQLGGTTRSANSIVVSSFNGVAMITLIDITFQAGTISLVDWMSSWDIIADSSEAHAHDGGFGAIQSLEISFRVSESRTVWLFAMDEILLTVGWLTTAFLVYTTRGAEQPLSKNFAHLSVCGALVAFIGFFLHVARYFSWRALSVAAALTGALVYLVLLPAWLVWLGVQLRNRSEAVTYMQSNGVGDVEMASSPPADGPIGGVIKADTADPSTNTFA